MVISPKVLVAEAFESWLSGSGKLLGNLFWFFKNIWSRIIIIENWVDVPLDVFESFLHPVLFSLSFVKQLLLDIFRYSMKKIVLTDCKNSDIGLCINRVVETCTWPQTPFLLLFYWLIRFHLVFKRIIKRVWTLVQLVLLIVLCVLISVCFVLFENLINC